MDDMRLLLAALLAVVSLAGCARAGPPPRPASTTTASTATASTATASTATASTATADVLAASAPFYLQAWQGTGPLAVSVIDGFTGQKDATIAAPKDAGSFPWMGGHKTWYPCGAAPDDRTFLLCDTDQYYELRLGDDGKPQPMSAPADIPAAARNTGSNGDPEFAVSPDRRLAAVTTATGGILVVSLVTGVTRSWTIPTADGSATSLSWAGGRYVAFQFSSQPVDSGAGGVRVLDTRSAATAALAASRLVISNERTLAGGISGV
jgi:predicted small lipoprotein YifL